MARKIRICLEIGYWKLVIFMLLYCYMAIDPQNPNNLNMSERQLGLAYWFVTHKILLKKIFIGAFIVFDAIFLFYGLYGFVDYFFIGGPREAQYLAQLPKNLVNLDAIYKERARNLEILGTYLIPSSGKYDLAAKIRNPNGNWWASFDYYFMLEGRPTEIKQGFVLPGDEKFILSLANAVPGGGARTASFFIDKIRWQKIDAHTIPNYEAWKKVNLNFLVSGIVFNGAVKTDSKVFSQADFKVKNLSANDFWQVDFIVILYRGPVLAGANFVRTERFNSSDERDLSLIWYESIPGVSKVEILPEVNVFDENNYIK